jgi:predicted Zn finger-like uncharacterized protein
MILTCPECATSYFVDDSKIPTDGRTVKCAACGARWTAYAEPAELELAVSEEEGALAREAEPAADEKDVGELSGEELPRRFRAKAETERRVREAAATGVIWAGMAGALVVLVAIALVFRVNVVRIWPQAASAYAGIGMPVNSLGLVIENAEWEPSLQDGHPAMSISGTIRNVEDHPVTSPPLRISLLDAKNKPLSTKIARPADATLPPGETRHFAIAMLDPPRTAAWLEIGFALDEASRQAAAAPAIKAPVRPKSAAPALRTKPAGSLPAPVDAMPLAPGSPDALPPEGPAAGDSHD